MDSGALASQKREILHVVAHSDVPVMVLQAPSLVITAASPGAHKLLDPIAQPLIGRRLRDFSDDDVSGALPLLTTGRITGYETLHKVRGTGQLLRLWIGALPNIGSRRAYGDRGATERKRAETRRHSLEMQRLVYRL